jgi:hypothetical protein
VFNNLLHYLDFDFDQICIERFPKAKFQVMEEIVKHAVMKSTPDLGIFKIQDPLGLPQ